MRKLLTPICDHVRCDGVVSPRLAAVSESGTWRAYGNSSGPTRLRRGCSHPPRRRPDQAASSSTQPLRRPGDEGLPPPFEPTAPRGTRECVPEPFSSRRRQRRAACGAEHFGHCVVGPLSLLHTNVTGPCPRARTTDRRRADNAGVTANGDPSLVESLSERGGILILRVWVEIGRPDGFRARIIRMVGPHLTPPSAAGSVDDVHAAVQAWLDELLESGG
jgi:hypothetical protein